MSRRRMLTDSEHQLVSLYIKNTNTLYLTKSYRTKFEGIAEQYNFDQCLSDSQIKLLKTSKYVSDMKKRSKNLKVSGRNVYEYDINNKLNVVYNPIGS